MTRNAQGTSQKERDLIEIQAWISRHGGHIGEHGIHLPVPPSAPAYARQDFFRSRIKDAFIAAAAKWIRQMKEIANV